MGICTFRRLRLLRMRKYGQIFFVSCFHDIKEYGNILCKYISKKRYYVLHSN